MEEFEGYKVPECTEEEVRAMLIKGDCLGGGSYYTECHDLKCGDCLFEKFDNSTTQRYLDHRYPRKIAVHCKIQEEWDRVAKKAGKADICAGKWESYKERACVILSSTIHHYTSYDGVGDGWFEANGYKIISAQEYLGEEKVGPKSGLADALVANYGLDGVDDCLSITDEGTIFKNDGSIMMWNRPLTEDEIATLTGWTLNKEEDMNTSIKAVYGKDKTYEEVEMVDKYFGGGIDQTRFGIILLTAHKVEVFEKAEALKKEEEEAKED